jgi:UDP-2,4-diacetamido-2,4,6-trideoxy-beta-L-altropyranose hydrolase
LLPAHQADAAASAAVLGRSGADTLVVDHYGLYESFEHAQRQVVPRIVAIDDLARRHDCDLLLDQNYFGAATAARYQGRLPSQGCALLGPHFALLGREYGATRRTLRAPAVPARRVLVFFGGSDASDETSKALTALTAPELAHLEVDAIVGANHAARDRVAALAAARPRTTVHEEQPSLAPFIARADLIVGAGGATSWERLCLGRPSVVVTVAANQEETTAALAADGLVQWAGRAGAVSVEELRRAIAAAVQLTHAPAAPALVDGYGAARVAACLIAPAPAELHLERAQRADAELLYYWRNDALARAMSFDDAPISWDGHLSWLERKLADPGVTLFIGFAGELPVGQARLEFAAGEAELSYAVDPLLRGLGFGTALVEQAVRHAGAGAPGGLRARVKASNTASRRIFERAGWRADAAGADYTFRLGGRDR